MKICKACGVEKPKREFYKLGHTSDGLNWRCIPCQNRYNREHALEKARAKVDMVVYQTLKQAPTERLLLRFTRKVKRLDSGCWKWTANLHPDNGYPRVWFSKHDDKLAHRVSYEWSGGDIPEGLTIDHLCRNRWCVNPAHMEVVSRGENNLRGGSPWAVNKRKTHCHRGHEFTPANTYLYLGMRHCRECARLRKKAHQDKTALALS
jgi:hypothetical protein